LYWSSLPIDPGRAVNFAVGAAAVFWLRGEFREKGSWAVRIVARNRETTAEEFRGRPAVVWIFPRRTRVGLTCWPPSEGNPGKGAGR